MTTVNYTCGAVGHFKGDVGLVENCTVKGDDRKCTVFSLRKKSPFALEAVAHLDGKLIQGELRFQTICMDDGTVVVEEILFIGEKQ